MLRKRFSLPMQNVGVRYRVQYRKNEVADWVHDSPRWLSTFLAAVTFQGRREGVRAILIHSMYCSVSASSNTWAFSSCEAGPWSSHLWQAAHPHTVAASEAFWPMPLPSEP